MASNYFPTVARPSTEDLKQFYVGKDIADVPKPAVVLDVAIIKRHCQAMLETVRALNVGFRVHVKSHKTSQIARLQVGDDGDTNFIASTIPEIETLVPLLKSLQENGRQINVLYGIPLVPSQVPRLATLARELGEKSITVMIDHPDQLNYLEKFHSIAGFPACTFVKVDAGYHRAGLPPAMLNKNGLLEKLAKTEESGHAIFLGVYSHSSLSYGGKTPEEAMSHLAGEIESCKEAIKYHSNLFPKDRKLVVSVGATPQVVSSKNLLQGNATSQQDALMEQLHDPSVKVELHAGVYPLLDMQQVGTNAVSNLGKIEDEIAISVVAEVCSVYNNGERSKPEALVAVGTLALGREPCQSYPGWGVVSSWRQESISSRLIVGRISQEHGILTWDGDSSDAQIPLRIGQAVRIYPNHACVTGALYDWYLVVDSSQESEGSKIVDVWTRVGGW
ncbi:hypothetical protein MW887_004691 [Aspergillus wentii]|nr:hypothetical protein MW887_004691 [Aspergillus wentii]